MNSRKTRLTEKSIHFLHRVTKLTGQSLLSDRDVKLRKRYINIQSKHQIFLKKAFKNDLVFK